MQHSMLTSAGMLPGTRGYHTSPSPNRSNFVNPRAILSTPEPLINSPSPSQKKTKNRDGEILIHGNGRYGYYKILVSRPEIEKCQHFCQHPNPGWFLTLDFFISRKWRSWKFSTCIWPFWAYLVNIWSYLVNICSYLVNIWLIFGPLYSYPLE